MLGVDATTGASTGTFPGAGCAATSWYGADATPIGTLVNFTNCTTNGWRGTGTKADPYRLEFDGINDHVRLGNGVTTPAGLPLGDSARSVEVWVRFDAFGSPAGTPSSILFQYGDSPATNGRAFQVDYYPQTLGIYYFNSGGFSHALASPFVVAKWYQIVATYKNRTEGAFYVNGALVYSTTTANVANTSSGAYNAIGGQFNVGAEFFRPFQGAMIALRVYDRAIVASEVHQNCQALADRANGVTCP